MGQNGEETERPEFSIHYTWPDPALETVQIHLKWKERALLSRLTLIYISIMNKDSQYASWEWRETSFMNSGETEENFKH